MSADEVEELTDEALETMLLMLGCYIILVRANKEYWHATQAPSASSGAQYYYFVSDDGSYNELRDLDKRALMLRCRDYFLAGKAKYDPGV